MIRLRAIHFALGGILFGDPNAAITGIGPLRSAGAGQITFLSHERYRSLLSASHAACIVVGSECEADAKARGTCIVVENPYLYYARLTQYWKRETGSMRPCGIHSSAVIGVGAHVDPSASIGALCVIESGAKIGAHSVLHARVTIGENCQVGERCLLHSGVVIGADGFGFARDTNHWEKIEQLGSVCIGNDVEIGANTCIDRGALGDTVIEDGVKIDNLVQVGHNVRIGRHSAIAGCAGIAGSASIGAFCTVGGGAVVLGHLSLADHVDISAATVVTRSLTRPGHYSGIFPIDENARWEKNAAALRHLSDLRRQLRQLENSFNLATGDSPNVDK